MEFCALFERHGFVVEHVGTQGPCTTELSQEERSRILWSRIDPCAARNLMAIGARMFSARLVIRAPFGGVAGVIATIVGVERYVQGRPEPVEAGSGGSPHALLRQTLNAASSASVEACFGIGKVEQQLVFSEWHAFGETRYPTDDDAPPVSRGEDRQREENPSWPVAAGVPQHDLQ